MADMPNVVCDGCGKKYKWKAELAGKKVKCKCGHVMTIPQPPQEVDSADDSFGAIELADESGGSSSSKPSKPSKPAKPAASPDDVKVEGLGGDDDPDAIEVAGGGGGASGKSSAGDGKCPSCGADLAPDAVLCIQCGYNQNTGKKLDTSHEVVDEESSASDSVVDKLKSIFKRKPK